MEKKSEVSEKKSEVVGQKSVKLTVAGEIWEEIKDKNIDMFALPNQKVHMYCEPKEIEPTKCYLNAKASAVLPALEVSVGPKYSVERNAHFIVVSRKTSE